MRLEFVGIGFNALEELALGRTRLDNHQNSVRGPGTRALSDQSGPMLKQTSLDPAAANENFLAHSKNINVKKSS